MHACAHGSLVDSNSIYNEHALNLIDERQYLTNFVFYS